MNNVYIVFLKNFFFRVIFKKQKNIQVWIDGRKGTAGKYDGTRKWRHQGTCLENGSDSEQTILLGCQEKRSRTVS